MASDQPSTTAPGNPVARFLFHHEIDEYPSNGKRTAYLALAVLSTIALYYTYFTQTGVTPQILVGLHMSFAYYVSIVVVSNLIGAFASLPASKTDKFGRANVVIYGLLLVGLIVAIGVPNAKSAAAFYFVICLLGLVEGAILVATPALIRDFSPQVGRAGAMGFWAVGPVAGSLITSIVATNTLGHLGAWQDQFIISGVATLVIFVLALFFLKDLSLSLREQLMVSEQDRALVEAKARGISEEEIAAASAHPWKQILKGDVVLSALGISLFLLIYYCGSAFFTIYWSVVFKNPDGLQLSTAQANGLNQWFWGADIVALIILGWVSDKLRVRKPFMLVGAIGGIVMLLVFSHLANDPHTSKSTVILVSIVLASFISMAYAPWMASFTELVEAKNPGLVGTGLALWGWILRVTVGLSFLFLPLVVNSVNPIVDNLHIAQPPGAPFNVQQFQLEHPQSVAFAEKNASWLKIVQIPAVNKAATAASTALTPTTLANLEAALAVADPKGASYVLGKLTTYKTILTTEVVPYQTQLAYLSAHQNELLALQAGLAVGPAQWQRWFYVCVGGMVLFIPTIFLAKGRWSPGLAKKDEEEHEASVANELKELEGAGV